MLVHHKTPFQAALLQILDRDGAEGRVALLKATYELRPHGTLIISEQQDEIRFLDEYLGEPGHSTVLRESDGAYYKPAADVVVIGSIFAPQGKPVRSRLAELRVGTLSTKLQAFGERRWSAGLLFGSEISAPTPFSEISLCWERAFGGVDVNAEQSEQQAWEPRNPIGTGFCANRRNLDGLLLPNIENPDHLITRWQDRPCPAGLSFTGRAWSPRAQCAGTYDQRWQEHRAPILPEDFDYHFFNGAPPGLIVSSLCPSNGDEAGSIGGIISGTIQGQADPMLYSFDVKVEGQNVVRRSDLMMHNKKNTF